MALITPGGVNAFDQEDVTIVDPLGADSARVWLTNGATVIVPLPIADVVDAINDPVQLLSPGIPSPTFGGQDVYAGAFHVAQVRQLVGLPDPLSLITMDHGAGGPYVSEGLAADIVAGINSITGNGAGSTYVAAAPFALNIVNQGSGNAFSENGPTLWSRIAPEGSTTPEVGDIVRMTSRVFGTVDVGEFLNLEIASPFPIPNAGFQCTTNVRMIAGDVTIGLPGGLLINRATSNTFTVESLAPVTLASTIMVDLAWSHRVDGV